MILSIAYVSHPSSPWYIAKLVSLARPLVRTHHHTIFSGIHISSQVSTQFASAEAFLFVRADFFLQCFYIYELALFLGSPYHGHPLPQHHSTLSLRAPPVSELLFILFWPPASYIRKVVRYPSMKASTIGYDHHVCEMSSEFALSFPSRSDISFRSNLTART